VHPGLENGSRRRVSVNRPAGRVARVATERGNGAPSSTKSRTRSSCSSYRGLWGNRGREFGATQEAGHGRLRDSNDLQMLTCSQGLGEKHKTNERGDAMPRGGCSIRRNTLRAGDQKQEVNKSPVVLGGVKTNARQAWGGITAPASSRFKKTFSGSPKKPHEEGTQKRSSA